MLKLILALIALITVGFFLENEQWNITLSGFGYEISFSVILLIIVVLILTYLMYLAAKPFGWINRYKIYCQQSDTLRRETLLTDVLRSTLDKNDTEIPSLLKKTKSLYEEQSIQRLLVEALYHPNAEVFEALYKIQQTKLAGLKGLISLSLQENNETQALRLIEKNEPFLKSIPWLQKTYFDLLIKQNEWTKALEILELLSQKKQVSKNESRHLKALILMQQGHLKEAFSLMPEHPAIALAYAKQVPEKAESVLITSFKKEPCYTTYAAYNDLIKTQPPTKRVKLIEKLISSHKGNKNSLLALAQTAYEAHLYGLAKEQMNIYFSSWPLTKQAAFLMAKIERDGWNHHEKALEWEEKGLQAEEKEAWFCGSCGHETPVFDTTCPICHKFGSLSYRP